MDLRRQYDIATDGTFNERVAAGMYTVALEVLAEPDTVPSSPLRKRTAQGFLMTDVTSVRKYAALVMVNPTIAALPQSTTASNITDVMILNALREQWNPLSGVI